MNGFFNEVPKPFKRFFEDDFWGNFDNMFQELEQQKKSQFPRVNIYESGNELICILAMPGVERLEDIHLNVTGNILTVSGSTNLPIRNFQPKQEEIYQGNFNRDIQLPYPVRSDKVNASYKRGLLFVYLHRLLSAMQPNIITIEDLEKE
ncbi:Hsp20/alpha crystallin family protein [Evansella sp. LMS18]|uniref:Hsp20/alpha crystallin family protein n=1 Tax=Evansella sp. LMS18 TaxID=2924033 RepID=UPI0020D0D597|nr:Hsp20/alpha crystallin family protein [Evansella sp. LMS18]UTR10084.1 Hsp20/alpha crystallin family protein [Evansella sp. LMS18]